MQSLLCRSSHVGGLAMRRPIEARCVRIPLGVVQDMHWILCKCCGGYTAPAAFPPASRPVVVRAQKTEEAPSQPPASSPKARSASFYKQMSCMSSELVLWRLPLQPLIDCHTCLCVTLSAHLSHRRPLRPSPHLRARSHRPLRREAPNRVLRLQGR